MLKILFLSIPTGGGHHQAARAMERYFEGREDVECRMLDMAENVNSALAEAVSKGYILTTSVTPKLFGAIYDLLDARENPGTEASRTIRVLMSAFQKKLCAYIDTFRPDIIVSTHPFCTITLNRAAKHHAIPAYLISIVTDFTVHPFWEQARSDYYVIASELLKFQALKKWGTVDQVLPLGIPIHPKFATKQPKSEARKALGLEDKFTVLIMMGSMGYGTSTKDAIKSLDRLEGDFQILAVCGSNKKLKSRLDRLHVTKKLVTYGYVDHVDVLMDACDCIVTKPGGLTTSEALAKRLPIIMLDPIPGQEDRNKEFMLNNGIAMHISENFGVEEAVYQLLNNPFKAEQMIANTAHFAKPHAAKELGEFILSLYEQKIKKNTEETK